jgi:prolipoprotein diacylglyceryl transferase
VIAVPAVIPSPTQGVWYLGPLPVRAYALCILVGILVAAWLGERRWVQRGGRPGVVLDVAAWAVPFGIVGGRLYHVITSYQPYFGPGGHPLDAFMIWNGGLGIWGAVALGGLGAWIGARRAGVLLPPMADTLAPGIVVAQAIGRWGNWFNNELYGGPTDRPWGLRIYEWEQSAGRAVTGADGRPTVLGVFQPTFLYESLWDLGVAAVLIWADRRFKIGHGRVFALYVLLYSVGRGWIEALRVDPANRILGLRLNLWTSLLVGLGALAYLIMSARLRPGREASLVRPSGKTVQNAAAGAEPGTTPDGSATEVPASGDADGTRDPDAPQSDGHAEQESARTRETGG